MERFYSRKSLSTKGKILIMACGLMMGVEPLAQAASERDCSQISPAAYRDTRELCERANIAISLSAAGVDCEDCFEPRQESHPVLEGIGMLAQPLAFLGASYLGAKYQFKSQEAWAGAYAQGQQQCTNRFNSYLDYNTQRGANPILPEESQQMASSCNGSGMGQYAGYGGLSGNGYGGFGNPMIAGGYSPGFLGGMMGPQFGGAGISIGVPGMGGAGVGFGAGLGMGLGNGLAGMLGYGLGMGMGGYPYGAGGPGIGISGQIGIGGNPYGMGGYPYGAGGPGIGIGGQMGMGGYPYGMGGYPYGAGGPGVGIGGQIGMGGNPYGMGGYPYGAGGPGGNYPGGIGIGNGNGCLFCVSGSIGAGGGFNPYANGGGGINPYGTGGFNPYANGGGGINPYGTGGFNPYANGGGGINPYGTGGFNPYANGNGGGGINPYGTGGFNPYANGGGGFNPYGPGMINGGLGVSVGPGYPNNGGYWGATGGPNGANGYGVPGMGQDYYNQQQQQMQAQMAMQGQAAAGYSRMQGNASVNQMANSALYQNYANAGADLYGRGGAGYYGGAPYAAGNLGGQFGINAGVSFALGM